MSYTKLQEAYNTALRPRMPHVLKYPRTFLPMNIRAARSAICARFVESGAGFNDFWGSQCTARKNVSSAAPVRVWCRVFATALAGEWALAAVWANSYAIVNNVAHISKLTATPHSGVAVDVTISCGGILPSLFHLQPVSCPRRASFSRKSRTTLTHLQYLFFLLCFSRHLPLERSICQRHLWLRPD